MMCVRSCVLYAMPLDGNPKTLQRFFLFALDYLLLLPPITIGVPFLLWQDEIRAEIKPSEPDTDNAETGKRDFFSSIPLLIYCLTN